ncbi:amino acid deaminase [Limnohabitans sp. G3-2]|uniref:amino acid deaminase n=1 Tax=Limnohabitans sp. G3-2 TaxID=1100711 RepID=UPI000C1EE6AD|nr:amino acid deaminase [Limnohabitans sp. G3-2]PIT78030.1 amino acid deaminase [Limnohabitans sp. G3-2]
MWTAGTDSDFELNAGCKGYPLSAEPCAVSELGQRGWHLLEDALAYPVAVLRRPALMHNLAWMQHFVQRKGVALAPHGKTTMSPELFRLQLQAGAWGLTFAHVHQLRVGLAAGAQRAIIANQLVSDADLDGLDFLLNQHPQARVWFLVDSLAQLAALTDWGARRNKARRWDVLLELGIAGYRTGCRTHEQALTLAQAMAASPVVRLGGVECYEGGLGRCDSAHDMQAVSALVRSVQALVQHIDAQQLWGDEQVLLSAGGSAVFDLVIPMLKLQVQSRPVQGVLRSGCYVTHDHWNYARYLKLVEAREGLSASLQPALEVWAQVQSVPEPGLAILSAGRRDLSFDQCMPMPVRWAARGQSGEGAMQATPGSWKVQALSDQHAHMVFDAEGVWPQVGDRVALGISHPCTTFDKWRWMAVIEDDGRISGAISTHF